MLTPLAFIMIYKLFFLRFQAVQKLVDEEFQGIEHLRTSTLHKKIANARHDFVKLSGSEDKLEALLQVKCTIKILVFEHVTVLVLMV